MTLLDMDNEIQNLLGKNSSLFDNIYDAVDFENWTYYIQDTKDTITVEFKIVEMSENMFKIKVIPHDIYKN